jgi:hypothetical protein
VRQEIEALHKRVPGFRINPGDGLRSYADEIRSSVFCLAPSGFGWGIRIVEVRVLNIAVLCSIPALGIQC